MNVPSPTTIERFAPLLIRHRMATVITAHGLLFAAALLGAFCLAYNFHWSMERQDGVHVWFYELFLPLVVLAVPIKLLVFVWTRQHRGSWRYVGLRDLFGVISAALIGTFLFLTIYFLLENIWRLAFGHLLIDRSAVPFLRQSSVFALDWACTVGFVAAARVLVRFYHEDMQPRRGGEARRVLIIGAGDAGETVLRELLRMPNDRPDCVGFLDDDAELGSQIHGAEVLGRSAEVREMCEAFEVREVLIALPHASPKTIRQLVELCGGIGVRFRTIPAVTDVMEGRVHVSQIRNVDIADLLGRQPVELDTVSIAEQIRDKVVLVTGAGGSIGAEICRQIGEFAPQRLVLVEQSENGLFEIDRELQNRFPKLAIQSYVADVTDKKRIMFVFAGEKPHLVFHAAAHKHVPMMEAHPGEAIKNNIGGTVTVADTCAEVGVATMVMVSTDKAVNPTSVMGCTKRVAEMYVQSLSGQGTTSFGDGTTSAGKGTTSSGKGSTSFLTVRFGNVLGSSGSVVPIFARQIARGGPVTVTHPEMVRYFMTIPEAAQLVLQAGTMGNGGEIFVLHMGDPVKIVDLARDMITLSGLRPGLDIEIRYSGIRPGEKLYEELSSEGEHIADTAHRKIGIWKHRPEDREDVRRGVRELCAMADEPDDRKIRDALQRQVPEYQPMIEVAPDRPADPHRPKDVAEPTTHS